MSSVFAQLKSQINAGNSLFRLLYINISVYLLFVLINVFAKLILGSSNGNIVVEYLYPFTALSTDFIEVATKPWTLITHLFVHSLSPWHLLGNMLYLYFMGQIFLQYFGQKQLVSLYYLSGIIGASALLIISNISPLFSEYTLAYGASAAVLGIVTGTAFYAPTREVFLFGVFKIQLQWIGIALILADLVFFEEGNEGGRIAHLGGAITGLFFALQQKKGRDITRSLSQLIDSLYALFSGKNKSSMIISHSKIRRMTDEEYNKVQKASQEDIDSILDKISKSGYDSLSRSEKEMLFRHSKK